MKIRAPGKKFADILLPAYALPAFQPQRIKPRREASINKAVLIFYNLFKKPMNSFLKLKKACYNFLNF